MPRFVLLRHECPRGYEKPSHWDFMLEAGEALLTWELRELPDSWQDQADNCDAPGKKQVKATRLADHRLVYLDYEGPLSGNRGTVLRVETGNFVFLTHEAEKVEVHLQGRRINAGVTLFVEHSPNDWQLVAKS